MSLILVTRYKDGIILAADSFVFDNDGEVPLKSMDFNKVLISRFHKTAMVAVGSTWVFHESYQWLKRQKKKKNILKPLSAKWEKLNDRWKKNRKKEIKKTKNKTLRPVSDSLLVLAQQTDLETIHIIDPKGKVHETKSFVMSGSGADLTRHYLKKTKKTFKPKDSLDKCLKLLQECYQASGHDLYVTGFPVITIVQQRKIIDLTKQCEQTWKDCEQKYFGKIKKLSKVQMS